MDFERFKERRQTAGKTALERHRNRLFGDPLKYRPGWNPRNHYTIERLQQRTISFGINEIVFRIHPQNVRIVTREFEEIRDKVGGILECALRDLLEHSTPHGLGRAMIMNPFLGFGNGGMSTSIVPIWNLNLFEAIEKLAAAMLSDPRIDLSELDMQLLTAPPPPADRARRNEELMSDWGKYQTRHQRRANMWSNRKKFGGATPQGASRRSEYDLDDWLERRSSVHDPSRFLTRKSLKRIYANLCAPLALIDGLWFSRQGGAARPSAREVAAWGRSGDRFRQVNRLVRRFTDDPERMSGPFSPLEISELAWLLRQDNPTTTFNLFSAPAPPFSVIGTAEDPAQVDVLLSGTHAYTIRSMAVFLGQSGVCRTCWLTTKTGTQHRCPRASCPYCFQSACPVAGHLDSPVSRRCPICHMAFLSQQCLQTHLEQTGCEQRHRCDDCLRLVPTGRPHSCLPRPCLHCHSEHSAFVKGCFVQPNPDDVKSRQGHQPPPLQPQPPAPSQPPPPGQPVQNTPADMGSIWVADFETEPDEESMHRPYLLMLLRRRPGHPEEIRYYRGLNCVETFLREAIKKKSIYANCIIMSHNGSR